jgi:hypothetical protein
MEQTNPLNVDMVEQLPSGCRHGEFGEEETQPWDAAWIDIGGEG